MENNNSNDPGKILGDLGKESFLVKKSGIKPVYVWLTLGLVAGLSVAIGLASNKSGEVAPGRAVELFKITSPISGENWAIGSTHDIKWCAETSPGTSIGRTEIFIKPNNGNYIQINTVTPGPGIALCPGNSGVTWTVPDYLQGYPIQPGYYTVKVQLLDSALNFIGTSEIGFNITGTYSNDKQRIYQLSRIKTELKNYFGAYKKYPDSLTEFTSLYSGGILTDPTGGLFPYDNLTITGDSCAVSAGGNCTLYHLGANLDSKTALDNYTFRPVLDSDSDACKQLYSGCKKVLRGTTIKGSDSGNNCQATSYHKYCYDIVSELIVATTTQPSITVISPNGGETFIAGSQMTVRWSTQNFPQAPINIYLFTSTVTPPTDLSYQWVANVAIQTANDGSATWTVPVSVAPGSRYFIRILGYDQTGQIFPNGCMNGCRMDDSDAPFSITSS